MQENTQIEESAESLVEDVETTLQERKQQAIENAREAESKEENRQSIQFTTTPVIGGEKEKEFGSEKVQFQLMNSLPNGKDTFTVDLPSKSQITDESHELNRLLHLLDVETEEIANVNGSKFPVYPKGDYDNPSSVSYELDIPPVPTKPNMLLYKLRRTALRLKLIRWGRTPYVRTNMFGEVQKARFEDDSDAKCMPESAGDLFVRLNWNSSEQRFVPTERGMRTLVASSCF